MIARRQLLSSATAAGLVTLAGPALAATPGIRRLRPAPAIAQLAPADMAGPADVWAYDGQVPGPEIRLIAGERVQVRLENGLEQPTSVHWHGIRIDNAMDGAVGLTQDAVQPGGSFDYDFVAPDAGSYWYHTHNRGWEQLARGLYGPLIVEEPEGWAGADRDVVLVLDDWRLGPDGRIDEESFGTMMDWSHAGRLGNSLTVNGVSGPEIPLRSGEGVRLRLFNTANARVMTLGLPGHTCWLVALDGHPVVPRLLADNALTLAPAQRADVLLQAEAEPGARLPLQLITPGGEFEAASFSYGPQPALRTSFAEPAPLPGAGRPAVDLQGALALDLVMGGGAMGAMQQAIADGQQRGMRELVAMGRVWAFNGIAGDLDEPLFRVERGRPVHLRMVNDTAWPHAIHIHGHHFKILNRNGAPDPHGDWRDTVLAERGETVDIAYIADNPGKWLLHCHMLEHQAAGMVTWFEVG